MIYRLHASVSYTKLPTGSVAKDLRFAYTEWYTVGRQAEKLSRNFSDTSGMCYGRLSIFDIKDKFALSYEVDEWSY